MSRQMQQGIQGRDGSAWLRAAAPASRSEGRDVAAQIEPLQVGPGAGIAAQAGKADTQAPKAGADSASAFVDFAGVEKSYGGAIFAVRNLDLTVARGEFLTFLGPSGSGKTTTLNMLAGFERPTRGTIRLDGREVDRLPPYERNIGMVFQNYALFPHMTVRDNVGFPLSVRKCPKAEMAARVTRALEMVRLEQFADRRPAQMSGGQQQRVALARALVFEPSLVLMDEPLGALDKKLREHMQIELKQLHDTLGITIIYVTHDQSEALTMSDRVAVFDRGEVAQIGAPDVLYNHPATAFVAGFIGENNALDGVATLLGGAYAQVTIAGGATVKARLVGGDVAGQKVSLAIRPEKLRLLRPEENAANKLAGTVSGRIYLGDHARLMIRLTGEDVITVKIDAGKDTGALAGLDLGDGASVAVTWSDDDLLAFPLAGKA
jgi:putative spermidine/putrescine transport system ATP-binding protein